MGTDGAVSPVRDVVWVGPSRRDLKAFPSEVQDATGFALYWAQRGERHPNSKPLKGFGNAGVLEIVEYFDGDTYRTVYTVRMRTAVYVLHAFQKKSTRGIATPQRESELIKTRLAWAERIEAERLAQREEKD